MGVTKTAGRSGYTSGRARPIAFLCGNVHPYGLVSRTDGDPTSYKSSFNPSRRILLLSPHDFFSYFLSSSACFLAGFRIILAYFVLLCIFLFSLGTFSILVIIFSVFITVRILNLLGNVFEIINSIFVISTVLGHYVWVLFWTIL
jgi:hypothetical protein